MGASMGANLGDPNGGIQPPIFTWWDLPADDVGPWWLLPAMGAPLHVRSGMLMQTVAVQTSERFVLQQHRLDDWSGQPPLSPGESVVWCVVLDEDGVRLDYPQRVVMVIEVESPIVWSLVDTRLAFHEEWDIADIPGLSQGIEQGFVVRAAQRSLLELFQLNLVCPSCATPGQQVVMGMPACPPDPWVDLGGCLVGPHVPLSSYRCIRCEMEWCVDPDGTVRVTTAAPGTRMPYWAQDARDPWRDL